MILGLTFIQFIILIFVCQEIIASTICAIKGEDYSGGHSFFLLLLYGWIKFLMIN